MNCSYMCTCANTYNGGQFRHLVNHLESGHAHASRTDANVCYTGIQLGMCTKHSKVWGSQPWAAPHSLPSLASASF